MEKSTKFKYGDEVILHETRVGIVTEINYNTFSDEKLYRIQTYDHVFLGWWYSKSLILSTPLALELYL